MKIILQHYRYFYCFSNQQYYFLIYPDGEDLPILCVLRLLRAVLDDVGRHLAAVGNLPARNFHRHVLLDGIRSRLGDHHPTRHRHDSGEKPF